MRAIRHWLGLVFVALALLLAQGAIAADNFTRQDITFTSVGKKLVGWLYVPNGVKPGDKRPTIVMAHGWSAVKEMYLDDFAAKFSNGGFVVLVFDYRNFGDSEGEPRSHIDPHMQLEDYRNAITWATLQPMVDGNRIGIWGSSYSGGHVIHLASYDRRVKCAVAQVPLCQIPRALPPRRIRWFSVGLKVRSWLVFLRREIRALKWKRC